MQWRCARTMTSQLSPRAASTTRWPGWTSDDRAIECLGVLIAGAAKPQPRRRPARHQVGRSRHIWWLKPAPKEPTCPGALRELRVMEKKKALARARSAQYRGECGESIRKAG